ncbi:unnamed protein product [Brassica oleracea]
MEKKLVREKQSNSEERRSNSEINDLPDPLLCHILSFLPTKDSVRSSLLSKRWRNLCGYSRFKLICYSKDIDDDSVLESWIDALVGRRVCHLDFQVKSNDYELFCMPLSLYSCNTLASLSLCHVALGDMELEFVVSLPCLKVMRLDSVRYEYDKSLIHHDESSSLETLITSCPVLEKLTIIRDFFDHLKIMRVRSRSLKSFTLWVDSYEVGLFEDHVVEIDAPRLEHMSLRDHLSGSIIIHSIAPYASVNIDVNFDGENGYTPLDEDDADSSKRTMIHDFLTRISTVCRMEISYHTLESFGELLPTFLGCCPNLHTLVLKFQFEIEGCPIKLSYVPPCFVSSLKYVELATQGTTKTSSQMKLARYFPSHCVVLKKLSLSKSFGADIIKGIKKIQRKSRKCIIVSGCLVKPQLIP